MPAKSLWGRRVDHGVLREGSWVLVGNCYLRVVAR